MYVNHPIAVCVGLIGIQNQDLKSHHWFISSSYKITDIHK